ncbi:MAG: hypothetical protein CM1200mP34_1150 [Verrucomicrobiales bacterium]|nr:MAG: hypothetical protein CM1200mP34_1150 [Verrucomicrobiales bacterium]
MARTPHAPGGTIGVRAVWAQSGALDTPRATHARARADRDGLGDLSRCFTSGPRGKFDKIPEGGYRPLVITWDVSPSMQLDDGGFDSPKQKKRTRAQRGPGCCFAFERIALDQVRISVVAFFTGAKPVVVDTHDLKS